VSDVVVQVERLSKVYRLGTVNHGTLRQDLESWWARKRGLPDPNSRVGGAESAQESRPEPFWALRDVSFDVTAGDVVGIVGRNGAGKSTLLKILSRVTTPTAGEVRLRGRVGSLLEVGTGFHPELTGRENVFQNGAILGMSWKEIARRFDEIVAFAEVESFIDTPVKRYSSGMSMRLAFAVAAHLEPEILIVDEVLAVGDAAFQKKCLGKIQDVSGEGRTVLFVSHNMGAVLRLCRRGIVLDHGQVIFDGDQATAVETYQGLAFGTGDRWANADRFGDRSIEILGCRLASLDGDTLSAICPGQGFRLHVDFRAARPVEDVRLAMAIRGLSNEVLAHASTTVMNGPRVSVGEGPGHFAFEVDQVTLMPGRYWLGFGITKNDAPSVGDYIETAVLLEVLHTPVYGSETPSPHYGIIPLSCRFRLPSAGARATWTSVFSARP
jgi:lipopolysaccharide transport system ATP-binding protein